MNAGAPLATTARRARMHQFHPLSVVEVRRETAGAVSVAFEVPPALAGEFRFRQGQHLTLRRDFGGVEQRRSYSLCNAIQEEELRIAVKEVPGGVFSGYLNRELRPGDTLEVMPPLGSFFVELDAGAARHYLAVAAGSGITPVLSILKSTLAFEPRARFTLIYGNRGSDSILFLEELEGLKNRYLERLSLVHVLSREPQDAAVLEGRIDAARMRALLPALAPPEALHAAFLCGPWPMIEAVRGVLDEAGMPGGRVHFELFRSPEDFAGVESAPRRPRAVASGSSRVSVTLDGRRSTFELERGGGSILDAALALRSDMPYACKGGVCCTCRARVLHGEVEMDVNFGLEPEELAAGYVLTCQTHPLSDEVELDYDA